MTEHEALKTLVAILEPNMNSIRTMAQQGRWVTDLEEALNSAKDVIANRAND